MLSKCCFLMVTSYFVDHRTTRYHPNFEPWYDSGPYAYTCSSSLFTCMCEAGHSSLCCRGTFVIFPHRSLLSFSLHFSFSSAFLGSLFRQCSYLFCGLPHFLQPPCSFVSYLSFWPCVQPISSGSKLFCQICRAQFQFLLRCGSFCNGLHNSGRKLCRDGHQVEFCCLKSESGLASFE